MTYIPKSLVLAASLVPLLGAAPALAQSNEAREMAERMADPALQRSMSDAVAGASEALLDIPIEPFARAMRSVDPDAARDIPRDSTLRDLAGPEAERMPREVARRLPGMIAGMASMSEAMERMLPEMRRIARAMGEAVLDGQPYGDR